MPIDQAIYRLIEHGVLGIAVVFLSLALIRKDKQVSSLYTRLVEKSDRGAHKYHELATEMDRTMKELSRAVTRGPS